LANIFAVVSNIIEENNKPQLSEKNGKGILKADIQFEQQTQLISFKDTA
jgi:hypothetical protein